MAARVLVTGASRGLGRAFAEALAARGRGLVLAARSLPQLDALAAELRRLHRVEVATVGVDLAAAGGPQALADACRDLSIEGLVNNAGSGLFGPFAEHDHGRLAVMLQLNVVAPALLCHRLLPSILSHRGFVVHVASTAALQAVPHLAAYAASKAFMLHLSEALSEELRPLGVRVLALCPGPTATDFFAGAGMEGHAPQTPLDAPEQVVRAALAGLDAGHPCVVAGWRNRLLAGPRRLLPRALATRVAGRIVARWHPRPPTG